MKIDGKRVIVKYREKYKPGMAVLKDSCQPDLHHLAPGFGVSYAELIAAGILKDGRDFQDIRVVIEKK